MTQDAWKIPGGGNSFPFDNYGDFVAGIVFEFEPNLRQTDKDGKEKTFPGGQPMLMHRIGIHVTDSSSPAYKLGQDASVYLKGGAKLQADGTGPTQAVVLAAIKAATGLNDLQPGAKLTVQYVAEGQSKDRMTQPPKYYKAWYEAPSMTVPTPGQPGATAAVASPGNAPGQPNQTAGSSPASAGSAGPSQSSPASSASPGNSQAQPAASPPGTSVAPVGQSAGSPSASPGASTAADEEALALAALAELEAASAAPDDSWAQDPRVAPLRAKGVSDEMIRKVLKI